MLSVGTGDDQPLIEPLAALWDAIEVRVEPQEYLELDEESVRFRFFKKPSVIRLQRI